MSRVGAVVFVAILLMSPLSSTMVVADSFQTDSALQSSTELRTTSTITDTNSRSLQQPGISSVQVDATLLNQITSTVNSNLLTQSLNQSVTVTPGDRTFVDGGIYTAVVTVNVGESGILQRDLVSSPALSIDIKGKGASIVGLSSSSRDYDQIPCAEYRSGCTITSSNSFSPASTHQVLVRFKLNSSVTTDSFTLTADPTPGDDADNTTVTYSVSDSVDSATSLAQVAEAKADLAAGYNKSYSRLLRREDFEQRTQEDMQEAFTIVTNDAAQSVVTSYTDEALTTATSLKQANDLETLQNAKTAYGMSQDSFGSSTTAGQINQITYDLFKDFQQQTVIEGVRDAGNTSYALQELVELSQAEEQAWKDNDRERVRTILHKKQYVLMGFSSQVSESYKSKFREDFDGMLSEHETPSLWHQSKAQMRASQYGDVPKVNFYFTGVNRYAESEYTQISETQLSMARDPRPQISLASSRSQLQSTLSNLSKGENETVTFRVSNGENDGVTSAQGYATVSHADSLKITQLEQVKGDADVDVINTSAQGEDIFYRGGSRAPAKHPLTDIREHYDPG